MKAKEAESKKAESQETESKVHEGNNVKIARLVKGYSQENVSQYISMPQSDYSIMERKRKIDRDILTKIAEFLDVSVKFLTEYVPEVVMGSFYQDNFKDNEQSNNIQYSTVDIKELGIPPSFVDKYITELKEAYEKIMELKEENNDLKNNSNNNN